jgi:hypothetical protein
MREERIKSILNVISKQNDIFNFENSINSKITIKLDN